MRCAAKQLHGDLIQRSQEGRLVERFEQECGLLGTLRHPHIVQFLGIYTDSTTQLPVLVMEFLPTSLTKCVDCYGRLPDEISYAILRDVALGLRFLHDHRPRIIHRDLSANNVLLTGDMTAKISDLGVAKIVHGMLHNLTPQPGAQSYMPPEALRPNPQYDIEVDVFSFGVMLVHILCGQWPIRSDTDDYISEVERRANYLDIIGRPSDEQEGHPLMPLIERCLDDTPSLRPSASELVERMNDAATQHPLTFNNRVEMMQRIERIQTENDSLQTQVSALEGQVERCEVTQREQRGRSLQQLAALALEVQQLQLQVANLETEKTRISTVMQALVTQHNSELSLQSSLLSQQMSTIGALQSQLQQAIQHLASGTLVHAFSPDACLIWRECASMPFEMTVPRNTVIDGMVYVGGGTTERDNFHDVCKYDPIRNVWSMLKPAPVGIFGVGDLNGKLLAVGGRYDEGGVTGESVVHVFEENTLRWGVFDHQMSTGLAFARVASHNSSLVVCGMPSVSSTATVLVYSANSSDWHSVAPPIGFNSVYSSVAITDTKYYLAIGAEGAVSLENHPSSPAVYCQALSTLLDSTASQDRSNWQRVPDTPCHRSHLAVTGGCLLALGGYREACNLRNTNEVIANATSAVHVYCPAKSSWVKIGDLPDQLPRTCFTATTLSSGELFIAGGHVHSNIDDRLVIDKKCLQALSSADLRSAVNSVHVIRNNR